MAHENVTTAASRLPPSPLETDPNTWKATTRIFIRPTYFHYSSSGYFNHMGIYPISDRFRALILTKLLKKIITGTR
jgi:hypothetical protein